LKKIFILHFNPIELYPPVQNVIEYAATHWTGKKIYIFTTTAGKLPFAPFAGNTSHIEIIRLGQSGPSLSAFKRYMGYLQFYLGAFWQLMIKRPSKVMYYETLSSYPVYLYKKWINAKSDIFIHYHEYSSPVEYQQGMILIRYFHRLEKWLYPKAAWVSHTNEMRMERFEKDIAPSLARNKYIFPNYPPRSWQRPVKQQQDQPLRIVYVGALSLHTMYTKEFANWVLIQQGTVTWDIYTANIKEDARKYFTSLSSASITLHEGIQYQELPDVLAKYDVGVILYTGHIENYIYNAPNKLFEYMACGLDVWFPDVMKGSLPYITKGTYPKVIAVDFTRLNQADYKSMVNHADLVYHQPAYFCEELIEKLGKQLLS
jgi:hypothetical protein